jgi:NAD(P)-dependent dehydrogenase (short-subunit alcohol dehydrogenase family)
MGHPGRCRVVTPEVLRAGVLEGVRVAIETVAPSPFADVVGARLAALGASLDPPPATLVVDAGGAPEPRTALDGAWDIVRPAAEAMIAGDGGQILLLAPPPGDAHAEAARAGLENLSRTLSVEWARYAIRPVTLLPGTTTSPAEVAELVCFLASPAGGYYAGCAFTLGSATA